MLKTVGVQIFMDLIVVFNEQAMTICNVDFQ